MRRYLILLPLLAAGCAELSTPVPVEAALKPGVLTVTLSNGARCTGARATADHAGPEGWSGHLAGCGAALPYSVQRPRGSGANPIHGGLVEVFDALGAKNLFAATGRVEITDARGQVHSYTSPSISPAENSN